MLLASITGRGDWPPLPVDPSSVQYVDVYTQWQAWLVCNASGTRKNGASDALYNKCHELYEKNDCYRPGDTKTGCIYDAVLHCKSQYVTCSPPSAPPSPSPPPSPSRCTDDPDYIDNSCTPPPLRAPTTPPGVTPTRGASTGSISNASRQGLGPTGRRRPPWITGDSASSRSCSLCTHMPRELPGC